MKTSRFNTFFRVLYIYAATFLICACNPKQPVTEINYANAVLRGNINTPSKEKEIEVFVCNPIIGERGYKTSVGEDGSFRIELPMLCPGLAYILSIGGTRASLWLAPGKETILTVSDNVDGTVAVNCENPANLSSNELDEYAMGFISIMQSGDGPSAFVKTLDGYREQVQRGFRLRMNDIDSLTISDKGKALCVYDLKCMFLLNYLEYKEVIPLTNRNFLRKENKSVESASLEVPQADIHYYTFLRDFNLNDPNYLYSYYFNRFINVLLNDEVLNIPTVDELTIDEWMQKTRTILQGPLGFTGGLFYDILASSAYYRNLEKGVPFTDVQKKSFESYFENTSFTNFLLGENERLISNINESASKVIIKEMPPVPKRELMDAILSNCKDSVVLVSFWATWSAPCSTSFREMELVKGELKDLNIKYVYIADTSSPLPKWRSKIWELTGEHYYLEKPEWEYLLEQFGFTSIPAYLIFDVNKKLRHKQTMFMGREKMIEWVNESLNK